MQEVNERECSGDLVCRRNSVDTAICQMRTGIYLWFMFICSYTLSMRMYVYSYSYKSSANRP